jgi:superfamily II DNA/RNA helicase
VLEEYDLARELRLGLDELGFTTATPVQQAMVAAALGGADCLVSAETGSGKTLAYLVPMVQRILVRDARREPGTQGLVLVPTRELARQVLRQTRQLLVKSPLSAQALTGGADFRYQASQLRRDPEILVATPGRLLEHIGRGSVQLARLQTLVLDEADRMLDLGFRDDVLEINRHCNPHRQALLLSATLRHRGVGRIASALLADPQTICIGEPRQAHGMIRHQVILADGQEHKDQLLRGLLHCGEYRRVLLFANKRSTAARLARLLAQQGLRSDCLHGELSTEQRKQVVSRFAEGKVAILAASDLAARGLDIQDIDLVVNYDLPHSGDDYLHRSGRTGRAGREGESVCLVAAPEWNLMISIERYLGMQFERRSLPGLKARYSGPRKTKSSGKAVGSRKKKTARKTAGRGKSRPSAGQRRRPRGEGDSNDGHAPLTRKR